jgi:hypothetical protein
MVDQVATVRKPAPEFEAMAWWNGFKKVKLSDFKGKFMNQFSDKYDLRELWNVLKFINLISLRANLEFSFRQVCCAFLLAP